MFTCKKIIQYSRPDLFFGINNSVWIGDAVTKASNLSSFGNKESYEIIVRSNCTYSNIIEKLIENNSAKDVDIIKLGFNDWISNGMHEN